jgi:hypothetical protein
MKTSSVLGAMYVVIIAGCSGSGCRTTNAHHGISEEHSARRPEGLPVAEAGPDGSPSQYRFSTHAKRADGVQEVLLELRPGPRAKSVPIRTGVPFPFGALSSLAQLRLEDGESGKPVHAQFDALATWPDGSLKVVLVQFVGDLGAKRRYRLAYGAGVSRDKLPRTIVTTKAGGNLTVDTGPMRFLLSSKGALDGLWRDGNNDGQFSADERLIDGGDVFLIDAFDGKEYTASSATSASVTLEEEGPLRAVVKATGSLTTAGGATHMKYLLRYYASQGSDKLDIELTLIDDRLDANVLKPGPLLASAAKGLGMRWKHMPNGAPSYRFGGESDSVYSGRIQGEHYLLQTGNFVYEDGEYKGNRFAYRGVGTGHKAPGWLSMGNGARQMTLMVKDFWQQYPSEISVDPHLLTAALFPIRSLEGAPDTAPVVPNGKIYRRPNTFYFLRPGGAKTYQLRLVAHREPPSNEELQGLNQSFQRHELDLVASPSWYTDSGVWGQLTAGGPDSPSAGYDAALLSDYYVPSFERADSSSNIYGWRDFGDHLRGGWANVINGQRIPSFYNDTHVGANNLLKQFLRTGDQRWYRSGEIATRHFMDIDVNHGPRQGRWKTGGSPQPAGELKCSSHENIDHDSGALHWGHAHVSGLSDLYLLTGDRRSLDVLKEIGNWWRVVSPYFFPLPFKMDATYREAERDFAWPLYAMNEYVRVLGDHEYHREVAGRLVNYLIQWWQTPAKHIGYNPASRKLSNDVVGINDASAGTGYWTMSIMDNRGNTEKANGTNPWMAGALVANIIKFYEQDTQLATAGKSAGISHPLLQNMLLQTQNYIVRYGYDAEHSRFVYSEAMRGDGGGDHHILFGLAYLSRLFKQESASGTLKHPEWYDTQPQWLEITRRRYEELRTKKSIETVSSGFYGYEIVYPPDFFAIARELVDGRVRESSSVRPASSAGSVPARSQSQRPTPRP